MALGGKDVLKLVVDADSASAVKEFDKLGRQIKTTVGDSEKSATGLKQKFGNAFQGLADRSTIASGALNKLGVSGQQAGMAIASAIPAAGIAAAGALALFAVKGVQAFTSTALAAGKFAEATGLSVQEASKWVAVADDVGVSGQTMQGAFVKMSKAIDSNRAAFGDLVATAKDGSVDMSQTFLNVITHLQRIEDPIKRANEASKFFGRGFAEVAEIINTDAATISASLAAASEEQIIDEEELQKAREYRAAMDALSDSVRDLSISIGGPLTDSFSALASGTATVVNGLNAIGDGIGDAFLGGALGNAKNAWNALFGGGGEDVDQATAALGRYATAENQVAAQANHLSLAHAGTAAAVTTVSTSFGNFEQRAAAAGNATARLTDELERQNDALQENINQQLAAIDSTFAVSESQRQFARAVWATGEATNSGTASAGELQAAYDAEAQAALGVARATVKFAEDQALATGASFDANDQQKVLIGTLMKLAGQASGPVSSAIGGIITKLQAVGAQKPNPTINATDNASGKINNVQASLNMLNGRSATVALNAIFNGGAAMSEANRFLNIARQANQAAAALPIRKEGGPIPGSTGTPVPILAHGGEYVLSADVVDRIKRGDSSRGASAALSLPTSGGSGGGATVVNFNGTFLSSKAELGRMVDEALAESRRRGNRAA